MSWWSKRSRAARDLSELDRLPVAPVNVRIRYDGTVAPVVELAYRGLRTPPGAGREVHVWEAVALYNVGGSVDPALLEIRADMVPARTAILVKFLVRGG